MATQFVPGCEDFWFCPWVARFLVLSLGGEISGFVPRCGDFWFCPWVARFLILSLGGEIPGFCPSV